MKEFIKSIPILSGLLIFIGYFNYLTYYRIFDIEISTYLSTSELLLSFLPLTLPILVLIGIFSFHAIGAIVILSYRKKRNRDDGYEDSFNIYAFREVLVNIIKNFRKKKYNNWRTLWLLLDIFRLIIAAAIIMFFVLYVFFLIKMIFSETYTVKIPSTFMIVLAVIWISLFLDVVTRADSFNSIKSPFYIKLFFITALFLGLIVISNKERAKNIMNGKPEFEIKLILENKDTLSTNSNIVFLGKTNNYIFLRNINENNNIIYKMDNVNKLVTKKKN